MNKGKQFTLMVVSAILGVAAWAVEPFAIERGKVPAIVIEGEMRPFVAKAAAEVVGMQRCLDAIEAASEELSPVQREMLFRRFGYQAEFSLLVCKCLSELSLAEDARRGGAKSAEKRHLQAALEASIQRDTLDKRYASGVWQHWYYRDLIYPYSKITDRIRKLLR